MSASPTSRSWLRSILTGLVLTSALVGVAASQALAAGVPGEILFGPASTVGSPFGGHWGLDAATNASGEVTLAWGGPSLSETGDLTNNVLTASVAPGGASTPIRIASSGHHIFSYPSLAVAPAGRAAVAWFEERPTSNQYVSEILALRVRDVLPGGRLEPQRTVWHPAHPFLGSHAGLTVACDQAGDEVLAWLTDTEASKFTVMVSSRRAGGAFTTPVALATIGPEAVPPAVAMAPNGEVTAVWAGPEEQEVLASTWPAGARPMPATMLDRYTPEGILARFPRFRDLQIRSDAAGDELATWLYGLSSPSDRPQAVALRAAWRGPGAGFGPTQTVSAPGVEVREPAVALSPEGRALVGWSEITSSGSGPQLSYATADPGGAFSPSTATGVSFAENSELVVSFELGVAWLPGGSALMSWEHAGTVSAVHWTPGGMFSIPTVVAHVGEFGGAMIAAGGPSDPVLVWNVGQLRYRVADGLVGPARPAVAPILSLTGNNDLKHQHGLDLVVRCSENCRLAASASVLAPTGYNRKTGAETDTELGALRPLQRIVPGEQTTTLRLPIASSVLRTYCRARRRHQVEVRAHIVATALANGAGQEVTLDAIPSARSCSR